MKKRLLCLCLLFSVIFIFAGCSCFDVKQYTDSSINNTITNNIDVSVEMPKSSDSIYQSPIQLPADATASDIASAYIDSVVTVFVVNNYNQEVSHGSGVCVHSGGYLLTNYHVINSALTNENYKLNVYLNGETQGYYAEVLWSNEQLDLAIIQCSNGDIPYVKMQDRVVNSNDTLQLLEQVIAIGTPLDFIYQNSCTLGYVSGMNRYTMSSTNAYEQLIQHTASISNGNSGGPLFDMKGNLIGLNTLGSENGNEIYFAVPIYSITLILDKVVNLNEGLIRTYFELPKLGINITDKYISYLYNQNAIDQAGVYVSYSYENSKGKLQVGDIITGACVGMHTYTINCRNDLINVLLMSSKGDMVEVNFLRDNKTESVFITLI